MIRKPDDETTSPNFGPCCACGGTKDVRNVLLLSMKAPVPGTGWGCYVCQLGQDGAVAVLCDACRQSGAQVQFACKGYLSCGERVPIAELGGLQEHDPKRHPEAQSVVMYHQGFTTLSGVARVPHNRGVEAIRRQMLGRN